MSLLNVSVEEQLRIITSGTDTIVPVEGLKKKLEQGRPLNIKLGVDPTSPDLHLGHAVPLQKMRQFQDLGHNVTLIIGNGTAFIGDPSGKNSTRPQLSHEQIESNAQTYVEQAMKVLDPAKTKIVHNGDWILTMDLGKLLEIASKFTVARILERDDFTKRYTSHTPIALHEFLYPVMQAYDSVMINADVEMGGRDQLFNLLAGRELMEKMGMEPQVALCMPLLEGTDGVRKMSKSYGNYVGLTDTPDDMFGKIMSIPDNLIVRYYRLATRVDVHEIDAIEADLAAGTGDPNALKRRLARIIIDNYHTRRRREGRGGLQPRAQEPRGARGRGGVFLRPVRRGLPARPSPGDRFCRERRRGPQAHRWRRREGRRRGAARQELQRARLRPRGPRAAGRQAPFRAHPGSLGAISARLALQSK